MMEESLQFVISETYETMGPDDIEPNGSGFNFKDKIFDKEELSDYLRNEGFIHPSQSPVANGYVWISTESHIRDMGTGESVILSLHCQSVRDGDGRELDDAPWLDLVREASGERASRPPASPCSP